MSDVAKTTAAQMGTRAGEQFVRTGIPSPCPLPARPAFQQTRAAWRRAYLRAVAAGRRQRRN